MAEIGLISHAKRLNYIANETDIISGVSNNKGNVVGIMPHAILDEDVGIVNNILKSLDVSNSEYLEIKKKNKKLIKTMGNELGICTGYPTASQNSNPNKSPKILVLTATKTGAGKTFITVGIAGTLAILTASRMVWKVRLLILRSTLRRCRV